MLQAIPITPPHNRDMIGGGEVGGGEGCQRCFSAFVNSYKVP